MLPIPVVESIKQALVDSGFIVTIRQINLLVWDNLNVRYTVSLAKPFTVSVTSLTNPVDKDRSEEISKIVIGVIQSYKTIEQGVINGNR